MIGNDFTVGQSVKLRKPHACGANEWVITRTGADVKLKCASCGRTVMLDRGDFLRSAVRVWGEPVGEGGEQQTGISREIPR